MKTWVLLVAIATILLACPGRSAAKPWSGYLNDADRSGATSEKVPLPLVKRWAFHTRRQTILQPVAGHGGVYFGSPVDHAIYCLDAATGKVRWRFVTGGEIHWAPWLADRRVYVGSDDGCVYCLSAAGALKWKTRIGPRNERIIGYGRMHSRWPVRGGIVLRNGVLYAGAGRFPSDGAFYTGLDPETGRVVWQRTDGETCANGYLTVSDRILYVPQGRVPFALIDLKTKEHIPEYVRSYRGAKWVAPVSSHGWRTQLAGRLAFTGDNRQVSDNVVFEDLGNLTGALQLVTTEAVLYKCSGANLESLAYKVVDIPVDRLARTRRLKTTVRWKVPCRNTGQLILAGDVLFSGGHDNVLAVDATTGKTLWKSASKEATAADGKKQKVSEISGFPAVMAAADGQLIVSTNRGRVYCFGPAGKGGADTERKKAATVITRPVVADRYAGSKTAPLFRKAAEALLKKTGVTHGYALVYGVETGELALELTRRTKLNVYCISPDAKKVAAVRKALDTAGVYGTRVCVDTLPCPYPDYFADLAISETALLNGRMPGDPNDVFRMLKPIGGQLVVGTTVASAARGAVSIKKNFMQWAGNSPIADAETTTDATGTWVAFTRPALKGSADWTHQWGGAANTTFNPDHLAKPPLDVLWYGQPGPGGLQDRHHTVSTPVTWKGRCFMLGREFVKAFNVYNGTQLWQRSFKRIGYELPRAYGLTATSHGLFVKYQNQCHRLDPVTGKTLQSYSIPEGSKQWGYVAVVGDRLYGASGDPVDARFAKYVFAIDIPSGKLLWKYELRLKPRAWGNYHAICVGAGQVYVLGFYHRTSAVEPSWQKEVAKELAAYAKKTLPAETRKAELVALAKGIPVVPLVALDARTGRVNWTRYVDARNPPDAGVTYADGVLLHYPWSGLGHSSWPGRFANRQMTARSAKDGGLLWRRKTHQAGRPMVVGDTVYAMPWVLDLHTGARKKHRHPFTNEETTRVTSIFGACGTLSASPNGLFGRAWQPVGYADLARGVSYVEMRGIRPSCMINMLPAAGLVVVPEGSSGCRCGYHVGPCTVVYKHAESHQQWGGTPALEGPMTPIKWICVNFGGSGEIVDREGKRWIGYRQPQGVPPKPKDRIHKLYFNALASFYKPGWFYGNDAGYAGAKDMGRPWLFGTGARGLKACTIPLLGEVDGTARYTVRLYFADPDNEKPGQRVFDVKLQGRTVLKNLDMVKETGGRNRPLVKEFKDVEVTGGLEIELAASSGNSSLSALPLLCGVECIREQWIGAGFASPKILLTGLEPEQSVTLRVANPGNGPLRGKLCFTAPRGLRIAPKEVSLNLGPGRELKIPVVIARDGKLGAGRHAIRAVLDPGEGSSPGIDRFIPVESIGKCVRVVVPASEDAFVTPRGDKRGRGTNDRRRDLSVRGGAVRVGDGWHFVAYIKFDLSGLQGRISAVRLRLASVRNNCFHQHQTLRVRLVEEPWAGATISYAKQPRAGRVVATIPNVPALATAEAPLDIDVNGLKELSLVVDTEDLFMRWYDSRGSGNGPTLLVDCLMKLPKPVHLTSPKPGLRYAYYQGRFNAVPDFAELTPKHRGRVDRFVFPPPAVGDWFALKYEGYIRIRKRGKYTFYLNSDDGSKLWIGETLIVTNDGIHGPREESGEIFLDTGFYPIGVAYFEGNGGNELTVSYKGPGFACKLLEGAALYHNDTR